MSKQYDDVETFADKPFSLLPLRRGVVLPGSMVTLPVGRSRSVALAKSLKAGDILGITVQREARAENPSAADMHGVGVFARVHRVGRGEKGSFLVMVEGLSRFELDSLTDSNPYWRAQGTPLVDPELDEDDLETRALVETLRDEVRKAAGDGGGALANALTAKDSPGLFADRVASSLGMDNEKDLEVLLTLDVKARLKLVTRRLIELQQLSNLKERIDNEVRRELGDSQKERILREQLRAIHKELGDENEEAAADELRKRLDDAKLPEEVRKVADKELKRLSTQSPNHPEHNVIRTYLEWIADLPWSQASDVNEDLDAVSEKLEADHYGLEDVKKRILEHMAVLKLSGNPRGTILCLAGPPGVGKTSLGQSIADATGRPFVRIALGGVRDEAEIRGHRRTYVGALPGRIIHALKQAKANNPVILLDEIDKLGRGWQGSPEAALLEVLDPEQNGTFTDHYMELEFDLSQALFICTANDLGNISGPLRDRLEIIEISGYTPDEKASIARNHLIPKKLEEHALPPDALDVSDEALEEIVRGYTREAGVRQLGREITRLCRAVALEVAKREDHKPSKLLVTRKNLKDYLGKTKFFDEVAERTSVPGVATGLAWTPVGGDILFIETSRMPGKGQLQITGKLGDVMQESARAALTYVRSNAESLGVDPEFLASSDVHIHVPAGAVPKDGPSAGVTIFTALTSLLTGRRVRPDTAMTGECTLRGRVLPVGGIKAKVLAAHRAGLTRVILPQRNERDLDDVPEETREAMEFVFADDMQQVLEAALESANGDAFDHDPSDSIGGPDAPIAGAA